MFATRDNSMSARWSRWKLRYKNRRSSARMPSSRDIPTPGFGSASSDHGLRRNLQPTAHDGTSWGCDSRHMGVVRAGSQHGRPGDTGHPDTVLRGPRRVPGVAVTYRHSRAEPIAERVPPTRSVLSVPPRRRCRSQRPRPLSS